MLRTSKVVFFLSFLFAMSFFPGSAAYAQGTESPPLIPDAFYTAVLGTGENGFYAEGPKSQFPFSLLREHNYLYNTEQDFRDPQKQVVIPILLVHLLEALGPENVRVTSSNGEARRPGYYPGSPSQIVLPKADPVTQKIALIGSLTQFGMDRSCGGNRADPRTIKQIGKAMEDLAWLMEEIQKPQITIDQNLRFGEILAKAEREPDVSERFKARLSFLYAKGAAVAQLVQGVNAHVRTTWVEELKTRQSNIEQDQEFLQVYGSMRYQQTLPVLEYFMRCLQSGSCPSSSETHAFTPARQNLSRFFSFNQAGAATIPPQHKQLVLNALRQAVIKIPELVDVLPERLLSYVTGYKILPSNPNATRIVINFEFSNKVKLTVDYIRQFVKDSSGWKIIRPAFRYTLEKVSASNPGATISASAAAAQAARLGVLRYIPGGVSRFVVAGAVPISLASLAALGITYWDDIKNSLFGKKSLCTTVNQEVRYENLIYEQNLTVDPLCKTSDLGFKNLDVAGAITVPPMPDLLVVRFENVNNGRGLARLVLQDFGKTIGTIPGKILMFMDNQWGRLPQLEGIFQQSGDSISISAAGNNLTKATDVIQAFTAFDKGWKQVSISLEHVSSVTNPVCDPAKQDYRTFDTLLTERWRMYKALEVVNNARKIIPGLEPINLACSAAKPNPAQRVCGALNTLTSAPSAAELERYDAWDAACTKFPIDERSWYTLSLQVRQKFPKVIPTPTRRLPPRRPRW